MNPNKLNLDWNTYSDHLREMLHEMMKSKELTDVTLVCDDKIQFKAHKIVLSACSSVFKSIINDLPQNSSVIYLRGIQHQEMESILEFIYLGAATFSVERMGEFLEVAKDLEIKEICKTVDSYAPTEETEKSINEENTELVHTEETEKSIHFYDLDAPIEETEKSIDSYDLDAPTEETDKYINEDNTIQANIDKYNNTERDRCDTEGIPDQSESKFPQQGSIRKHIHTKHEFVKYSCHQCDYQAAWQDNLMAHIQSKHEGIKFICDQCKQQFASKGSLKNHIQSRHEVCL